ncbi:MAG: acyl carrier protein [Deltaproteobacteria bacterium]|nr:acyl carrier protein [Deltaproteobacteria bacterium]
MSTSEHVLQQFQSIFEDIFGDEVQVSATLTADDVEDWDSLSHVTLILAIERHFGVRFATGEVEKAKNVGELAQLVLQHLTRKS